MLLYPYVMCPSKITATSFSPHVSFFCLAACLGTSQKGLTHPSLDLTAYMTAFLKGVKGYRGVWANGGKRRWKAEGREGSVEEGKMWVNTVKALSHVPVSWNLVSSPNQNVM